MVKVEQGDHVVFSADPIPGNENAVYKSIDGLARLGATISYSDVQNDLHVSGHASSEELRLMLTLLKPKYVVPIGGMYRHMNRYKVMATKMGWRQNQILLPDEGQVIKYDKGFCGLDNQKIRLKTIIVDGLGIGDVGPAVLGDRKKMAQSGMIVVAVPVDNQTNKVEGKPEVITRGFVFARESQELLEEISFETMKVLPEGMIIKDWKAVREEATNQIERFVFTQTQREPLVLVTLVRS